ncbi:MAG TPA: sigma-70 family RNA polymerase sigma factor [Polyangia bacterium]|nr:sigma-70 family RNA polymerase sigma factor [Polyangia bacterium]
MPNLKRKPNTEEELSLLAALLAGRRTRWTEFTRRYERLITSCVLRTLRRYDATFSRDDLEDLVSEVWVALLRDDLKKLRAYQPDKGFRLASWIALIATNTTIDRLRARQTEDVFLDDMVTSDLAASANEPDQDAMERQRAELAQAALGELSPEERAFVNDCFHEQRAPEDIAREHGVAVNTIYSRKFKIREKLARIVRRLEEQPREPQPQAA